MDGLGVRWVAADPGWIAVGTAAGMGLSSQVSGGLGAVRDSCVDSSMAHIYVAMGIPAGDQLGTDCQRGRPIQLGLFNNNILQ
jgi:hypothetical protein